MSWVTRTTVLCSRGWTPVKFPVISARVIGSSAPNGSSIGRTAGSQPARAPHRRAAAGLPTARPASGRQIGREGPPAPAARRRASRRAGQSNPQARHDGDVLLDSQMRKEPDVLKHVTDRAPQLNGIPLARVSPGHEHDSPRSGSQQAVDQLENRRFAGAAPPDQRQHFAGVDSERKVDRARGHHAACGMRRRGTRPLADPRRY